MTTLIKTIGFVLSIFVILIIVRVISTDAIDNLQLYGFEGFLHAIWKGKIGS